MNNVDKQYLDILKDIIENGTVKETRAGLVKSVFGRMMRFDLKDGLPLLTTKKVFTKGIIHELLWFLSGNTNIKYLVDNGVHIWDDDAYRYYCELIDKHNAIVAKETKHHFYDQEPTKKVTKDEFMELVKKGCETLLTIDEKAYLMSYTPNTFQILYKFGDLGDVYGKQWRRFGFSGFDQIQAIVDKLKNTPDDRRMLCVAFNQDALNSPSGVALPPCHTMFQFYTRELTVWERFQWLCEHSNGEYDEWKSCTDDILDDNNVPKRALSLMYNMRSNDWCCGQPYNSTSYALLVYMMCEVCNMVPDELVFVGGDCHVYMNHIEGALEQLSRNGSDKLPKLKFARKVDDIFDFKYDDFIIEGYEADPPIKYQLNVG